MTSCNGCPARGAGNLVRLGIHPGTYDYLVALAGNPNTGKSTVFNAITGLRQHTGNWPGKTVTRAEGGFSYGGSKFKLVDLPGTYSLLSTSADEEVARDFLLFGQPDVTVIVVDATCLERNLNLVLQVFEITGRAVVCLNLIDEAQRHGLTVDSRTLSKELGVPVIPAAARQGIGIPELLKSVHDVATGEYICRPRHIRGGTKALARALEDLACRITAAFPGLPNARWVALRLLEGDQRMIDAVRTGELEGLAKAGAAAASRTPATGIPE
ncbi:MAG: Fe(2+) transport system protein [Acidobacteria bacterium]|nr:Fe(2+) transport system protein [Acidobacteriota bacterium]